MFKISRDFGNMFHQRFLKQLWKIFTGDMGKEKAIFIKAYAFEVLGNHSKVIKKNLVY